MPITSKLQNSPLPPTPPRAPEGGEFELCLGGLGTESAEINFFLSGVCQIKCIFYSPTFSFSLFIHSRETATLVVAQ